MPSQSGGVGWAPIPSARGGERTAEASRTRDERDTVDKATPKANSAAWRIRHSDGPAPSRRGRMRRSQRSPSMPGPVARLTSVASFVHAAPLTPARTRRGRPHRVSPPPGIRTRPGIQSLVFTTSLISDDRDKLPPSQWIIRLPVGADDGDAYRCDVHLAWSESRPSAQSVVDEALERLAIVSI